MEIKIGNSYIIIFEIGGKALTYHCKVTSIDDMFVSFIDKFGKKLSYNKSKILSYEEVGDNNGY